ncbi:MAG: hypothetical protein RRY29_10660 [Desulfovibrionaceae bacterium]
MIIDSNLVFTDSALTVTGTSDPVALTSLSKPGRMDPIPLIMRVTEDFNNLTSLSIKLTECASQNGTYTEVPAASTTLALADLKAGKKIGWPFLPSTVEKPWLKWAYTLTGTAPTTGRLFVALLREREDPYEAGMYISGGIVKG